MLRESKRICCLVYLKLVAKRSTFNPLLLKNDISLISAETSGPKIKKSPAFMFRLSKFKTVVFCKFSSIYLKLLCAISTLDEDNLKGGVPSVLGLPSSNLSTNTSKLVFLSPKYVLSLKFS